MAIALWDSYTSFVLGKPPKCIHNSLIACCTLTISFMTLGLENIFHFLLEKKKTKTNWHQHATHGQRDQVYKPIGAHAFLKLCYKSLCQTSKTLCSKILRLYMWEDWDTSVLNLNVSCRKNALHFKDGLMSVRNLSITSALPQFIL